MPKGWGRDGVFLGAAPVTRAEPVGGTKTLGGSGGPRSYAGTLGVLCGGEGGMSSAHLDSV